MFRTSIISIIPIFFSFTVYGQQANYWYFGDKAGLNFNTSPPTALTDGQLNTFEGCATISDNNGALLFYTSNILLIR